MSMASLFFYNQLKKLGLIDEDDNEQEQSSPVEDLEEETNDD